MASGERSGAAGRTPPLGGGGSGRGPAAASSVKVDTSDVQKLSKLLGDAAGNADKLAKALTKFDSDPLKKLNAEVQSLRGALAQSGVRSARTTSTQGGNATGTRIANQHAAPISGTEHTTVGGGGGSYLTGHWTTAFPAGVGRVTALGVSEAMSGASTLMRGHMQDAINRSYLESRWQIMTGGNYGYGGQVGLGRNLAGMFGNNTLGYNDTTQAAATLMQTGAVSGRLGASRVASAAFGASLNPLAGATGGAQMTSRVFTSQNYYRARLAGINQMAGGRQNLQTFMDQVISRYESAAGHKLSQAEIQSGNQPGMPLYLTLQGLGFADDGDRQNLLTYWSARNRTGKTGAAAMASVNQGLSHTYQQNQNARGRALSSADVGAQKGMIQGLRAKQAEYQTLGAMADTPFGRVITDATGALSQFSGELKTVNKLIEGAVGGSILRRILTGGGGAAAAEGAAGGGGAAAGGGALARGAVGRLAPLLGRAALPLAIAYQGYQSVKSGFDVARQGQHHNIGGALMSAAQGNPLTAPLTWGTKTALGFAKNLFGDSNRKSPPLTDSGVTWPQLEKLAQKGPPHIVTSTLSGSHAQNSYHYRGQAIDVAAPGGGPDSPGLLAINRYWASRYGRKLKELIYAGPGGVCIKDGKVVNGMAFYGAATMAEHHNHVHVAATPRSLAGAGGGVAVGAVSGNNAGTDSVGAAPASSSGGFGGGLIGSLFGTSSGGSLLAALASMGGGGAGGGYAASASAGGTSSSGATTGGRAATGAGLSVGRAPTSVSGNVALAKKMAASMGWVGSEWDALYAVWNQESGFSTRAGSPGRAYGIPQALPGSKMSSAGSDWMTNPATQIKWGLGYVKGRYHDPLGALAHKHATDSTLGSHDANAQPGGWYETGKWNLIRDEIAQLHRGEMVVPASTAEKVRQAISAPAQNSGTAGRRGGRTVPVQLVFMVQNGTETEMRQAARRFAKYVEDDHDIELVSSS